MNEGGTGAGGGGGGRESGGLRRLTDEPVGDQQTLHGWAVGLLRRASPHRPPVGRKQRVRLALGQGARGRRRALPLLRPAIAGVVLIGCGAAASAALGRWPEIVQAYHRLLAPASPTVASDVRARRFSSGLPARASSPSADVEAAPAEMPAPSPQPVVAPVAIAAPAVTASSPGSTSRASLHGSSASWRPRRVSPPAIAGAATLAATKRTTKSTSKGPTKLATPPAAKAPLAPAPAIAPAATEDTTPVLQAVRALRVEANPARARRLLAGYLERNPDGSLVEEALAMSIEAAVAHGDDDASALARRYLRRYPSGHFSTLARQTLDGARN
jgi:hypothetical protein